MLPVSRVRQKAYVLSTSSILGLFAVKAEDTLTSKFKTMQRSGKLGALKI
jgi:hypothetical protein